MGWTSVKWVLLLALGAMILGAIQCPHTPKGSSKRSGSPLKSIGKAISRKLSRVRSGGSSGSSSGSDNEQSSGNYSGGGRIPRSRSPSPTGPGNFGGGGGAGWSSGAGSSSGSSTTNRMYAAYTTSLIPEDCVEINNRGAAQIINNMQISVFTEIIRTLRQGAATDECNVYGWQRSNRSASKKCQEMYGEFKKIEPHYRGECSNAVAANCVKWPAMNDKDPEVRKCTFFVQTGIRSATRLEGFYISLQDCIAGIQDQMFMNNQLAEVGIRPPQSPPKPLLPDGYSPEW